MRVWSVAGDSRVYVSRMDALASGIRMLAESLECARESIPHELLMQIVVVPHEVVEPATIGLQVLGAGLRRDLDSYLEDNPSAGGAWGAEIESLTPRTALRYWLEWHGIVGWTGPIIDAVGDLGVVP